MRAARATDIDQCNRVCSKVHGHDRAGELADAIQQGTALVVERQERITGYATVLAFFGHSVGETNLDLKALIASADGLGGLALSCQHATPISFVGAWRTAFG